MVEFEVLSGLIGSAVGALLVWIISRIVHSFEEARGLLTGEWEQIILDPEDKTKVTKRDKVKCRQRREMVEGTIERIEPRDQSERTWSFKGRYRGQLFFGHFWSRRPEDPSYGTLQLRQVSANRFVGFYVRLVGIVDTDSQVIKFTDELTRIPFEWQKRTQELHSMISTKLSHF